ncbi:MAG: hypothetical protein ABIF10_01165 [Candidatus Woesearchaeota archaeon]
MEWRCVILDADGVVIDKELFSAQLERDYGIRHEATQEFFSGVFQPCLVGKQDLKRVLVPYLEKWHWKGSVNDFLAYWFRSEYSINQKVMDLVQNQRRQGVSFYIATNQEKYRTEYMKHDMGFEKSFDDIFSSAYLGCKKDDRMFLSLMYESISRSGRIARQDVLFWDDDIQNVEAAREFGFNSNLFDGFDGFRRVTNAFLRRL